MRTVCNCKSNDLDESSTSIAKTNNTEYIIDFHLINRIAMPDQVLSGRGKLSTYSTELTTTGATIDSRTSSYETLFSNYGNLIKKSKLEIITVQSLGNLMDFFVAFQLEKDIMKKSSEFGVRTALSYLYSELRKMHSNSQFSIVDRYLSIINLYDIDLEILLGTLMYTYSWKDKLKKREFFLKNCKKRFLKNYTKSEVEKIFHGLD